VYEDIRGGSIGEGCRILATYTSVQIVLLDRITQSGND